MRRRSPSYSPPPRRGRGRSRSPSPRGRYPPRREPPTSLLVRNIPKSCRAEDLRPAFKRFGPLRDIYLPKDYHTGEARGFGFVQYLDPLDAEEAQYHMNRQILFGRELTVIFAEENRKKPFEMRNKERMRSRGFSEEYGRSHYHRGCSRSQSRSRTPPRWDRYSRYPHERPHSYSPPESPGRREPGRRHEGGWSGSESRKYVARSPSGFRDSPAGRCSQKSSKHETHSDSWREEKLRGGRHKSPSHYKGSPAERYSRSPSRSPDPPKRGHSFRHSNSSSHDFGSPAERYSRSPSRSPEPPKRGHSSRQSNSGSPEDDSPHHSDRGPSPEHSSMDD